ncbi:MAG TPA: tetratricopeptide repeat protein [Bellilinea sp.]|nr:tetratricopeptide repeat protein [Bellilinea sp.]
MAQSFTQWLLVTCPRCGENFFFEFWLVVDMAEHPELADHIHSGTFHHAKCKYCGQTIHDTDIPLLLYLQGRNQPLLYVPGSWTSDHLNAQQREKILNRFKRLLANHRKLDWRTLQPEILPYDVLPHTLDELKTLWLQITQHLAPTPQVDEVDSVISPLLCPIITEIVQLTRPTEMPHRIELCRQALNVVHPAHHRQLWGFLQRTLADSLVQNPLGNRTDHLEEAIACYQQALQAHTRSHSPIVWAQTMNNLGVAYVERIQGERAANIELAIESCVQALEVRTRQNAPIQWAETTVNLANAYQIRVNGKRSENIEQAITLYREALQVFTQATTPLAWAKTMVGLANVYQTRLLGDRAENIEWAIGYYQQALQTLTRDTVPIEWAFTICNLAAAFSKRIRGQHVKNLDRAIEYYQQALEILSFEHTPEAWRIVSKNLEAAQQKRFSSTGGGGRSGNMDKT